MSIKKVNYLQTDVNLPHVNYIINLVKYIYIKFIYYKWEELLWE